MSIGTKKRNVTRNRVQIQSLHTKNKKPTTRGRISRPGIRLWRRYLVFHDASRAGIGQKDGYVNRILLHLRFAEPFHIGAVPLQNKKDTHTECPFVLEVQAGFEPADNGVADRGLTTWLLHQTHLYFDIISKILGFVKGKMIKC